MQSSLPEKLSTINISSQLMFKFYTQFEDVCNMDWTAYNLGVKGITVYIVENKIIRFNKSPKSRIERCLSVSSKEVSHESGCVTCKMASWSQVFNIKEKTMIVSTSDFLLSTQHLKQKV